MIRAPGSFVSIASAKQRGREVARYQLTRCRRRGSGRHPRRRRRRGRRLPRASSSTMNSRFSGSSGFGSRSGNDPSGSKKQRTTSTGSRASTGGSIAPAIPFPASITMRSGRTSDTSMRDITRSTYAGQMSTGSPSPPARPVAGHRRAPGRARRAAPTRRRPAARRARTIFIPVYSFGLCDAVTVMPPSRPSSPTAK